MRGIVRLAAWAVLLVPWGAPAKADITVGVILSITGPAAALGGPERNAIELMPATLAGQKVRYVVLDDASDTTVAVRNARKLIDDEHVDVIFGPSTTPNSLAVLDVAADAGTPMITVAGCAACIVPPDGTRRWAFKLAPNDAPIMNVITADMARNGVKSIANFAFATSFGDAFAAAMSDSAQQRGIPTLLTVRYNPGDASVTPQALRVLTAKPDAVFIAGSGGPAVTPVIEMRQRGYRGLIYSNPGAAGTEILRLGGSAAEGFILAVSPFFVAEQLDDNGPVKPKALRFVQDYEAKFSVATRSQPAASMWDAGIITGVAAAKALEEAKPGTAEFRRLLRDGLEKVDTVGIQGPIHMTRQDHSGTDERALVLARVQDGRWTLVK